MAILTVTEFLKRYDWRDVGDLVSDDDIQVPEADLASDTKLAACIADAEADIETALITGKKYTTAQLAALTGNSLSKYYRVASEITMFYLHDRRVQGRDNDAMERWEKLRDRHIKRLQSGENVFNIDEHIAAGVADLTGPSIVEYQDLNLVRDRTKNYYPPRHLPGNR